jgi:hypothetical protein
MLGADYAAEMTGITAALKGKLPYMLGYSGGEICPVYNDKGQPSNRFHNFTFVACMIK